MHHLKFKNNPMHIKNKILQILSPAKIITLSFLLIIIVGGILLSLPIAHAPGIDVSFIDAFFTSVSAVCVTGLVTLTTAYTWSLFGKIVILLLIQIGGLSLISIFTFFMVYIGKKISLRSRLAMQAATNNNSLGGMVKMVKLVIKGTLFCEGVGAIILFFIFLKNGVEWHKALFYGIFHSISAFCNAGFDVMGDQSFIPYVHNFSLNLVIMLLILVGGIGFIVWRDVILVVKSKYSKRILQKAKLSLHSKLALVMTAILLVSGTILFLITEFYNKATIGEFSFGGKLLASMFQSVTLRTAGFATIAQNGLSEASKLLSSIFMLIGGSPGGTAGGIKTVTIAVIFFSVLSIFKCKNRIVVFDREVSINTLRNALTIIVLMLSLLFLGTSVLVASERYIALPHSLLDLIFEVSSALGTVGLSTGLTPYLTGLGKLTIMICMFIGRIGPITLIISLIQNLHTKEEIISFPTEDVMIG